MADPQVADDHLRAKDEVLAARDLPRVPAGTRGEVVIVTGLTWIRYRVLFENGVELNLLDRSLLTRVSGL